MHSLDRTDYYVFKEDVLPCKISPNFLFPIFALFALNIFFIMHKKKTRFVTIVGNKLFIKTARCSVFLECQSALSKGRRYVKLLTKYSQTQDNVVTTSTSDSLGIPP